MVAKLKKGGNARLVFVNFADNDTCVIPAGFKIKEIVTKKSGTVAGNLAIGTTDGGVNVVNTVALGTVDAAVAYQSILITQFAVDTTLYVTVSSAATGTLAISIQKLF